jgi:hypothetical protein
MIKTIQTKHVGDEEYRELLWKRFRVTSCTQLSSMQAGKLIDLFVRWQWVNQAGSKEQGAGSRDPASSASGGLRRGKQAAALRARIEDEAATLENGRERMIGLVKKIGQVDRLEWCRDIGKLKRILKILGQLV